MSYRKRYYVNKDPYWTKARFTSTCTSCGKRISKGEDIYYYPNGKSVYCNADGCGQQQARSFACAVQDESFYNSMY